MRKIICDKCLKELPASRPEWGSTDVKLPKKQVSVDLCDRCQARLERWLSDPDPQEAAA